MVHHEEAATPTVRDRASDALLRVGTTNAVDRAELARGIASVPASAPGYATATGAIAFAGWVDAVVLWLSWRLRSTRFPLD